MDKDAEIKKLRKALRELRAEKDKAEEGMYGKIMPQAVPLEEAALGAMMLDREATVVALDILKEEMMYHPPHVPILRAIRGLHEDSKPVDLLTVTEKLKENSDLDEAGGPYYLVGLTNRVASAANLEYHASIIREYWKKRELISLSTKNIRSLFDNSIPVSDVIKSTQNAIVAIDSSKVNEYNGESIVTMTNQKAQETFDRGGDLVGERIFGIPEIDELIGGGEPGDLIAIGGVAKAGKSSISNNLNGNAVEQGWPIHDSSGEMTAVKRGFRLKAYLTGYATSRIERGEYFGEGQENFLAAIDEANKKIRNSLVTFYDGDLSKQSIRSAVFRHKSNGGRFFLIDRIGLFDEVSASKDVWNSHKSLLAFLRTLAKEMEVCIVVYSQLNGEAYKGRTKRPDMSHFMGATGVTANCTKALIIYRPEHHGMDTFQDGQFEGKNAKGKAEIICVLNNFGDLGSVLVNFDGKCQCLRPLSEDEFPDFPTIDEQGDNAAMQDAARKRNDEDIPF